MVATENARHVTVAKQLVARLDLRRRELSDVAALVGKGSWTEALGLWRDQVVRRFRTHDFGQYGWHGYALHPRPAGAVDALAGLVTREQYLAKPKATGFIDIYGMSGPPGTVRQINWFVDITAPVDWGNLVLAKLDPSQQRAKTGYGNFRFAKAFVGRYWQTAGDIYLRKAFDILSDFARNHKRLFWRDYHAKGIGDKDVRDVTHCDWRLNTNGLSMGWRAKNFLKVLAGFCKCLSADKPKAWDDVLKPVHGPLVREELDRIPVDQLAEIAVSLMRDHTGKLLWFCVRPGAVPNQRAEGLKALAFLTRIFPNFKTTPQLAAYVERGYEEMLQSNFLPDGGSLEQSFNYNHQDKEGLEEVVRFFGDTPPPFARKALEKVRARREVDDGLQTPLGGLPQVGNGHAVLGKAVWESDEAARRYWVSDEIHGKRPLRPQSYTSKAFRYSGFYAMRSGWDMKDLYLFFMNGRPQRGHSMRDNLAIQVTAYGRQLVVCGGSPTYGNFRTPEARGADFYLSEASSLKNNTVLVDGRSQAKNAPRAATAYKTPVRNRWHTSARFDLVDGLYDLGYGEHKNNRNVNIDMTVQHYRKVIFVKAAKLWLVHDRVLNKSDRPHAYTQVWNFLPRRDDRNWLQSIAGFREDQVALDAAAKRFRTTDPDGPNVEFLHAGPERIEYRKYFGHRDPWLGWYATGIGDARPAVDVHVNWQSADGDTLLVLLVPLDKGQPSPVRAAQTVDGTDGKPQGLNVTFDDGLRLQYRCAAGPQELSVGSVTAAAESLLVCRGRHGALSGIAGGCRKLVVGKKPVAIEAANFEFARTAAGGIETTPISIPKASVSAKPEPLRWPSRAADLPLDASLQCGLRYQCFAVTKSIRLYDLMLRQPTETGLCDGCSLDAWKDRRNFGVKWDGYLRIPRDGVYRFACHSPVGARVFLYNPEKDLEVPPVVAAHYRAPKGEASVPLKAGFHQLQIQYIEQWNKPNVLVIEIEGPGVERQPLPSTWLYRKR